jgi:rubrerythrin
VHTQLYPEFSKTAREENYARAAETWDAIIVAEKHHEKCFLALAENIRSDKIFKRDGKAVWRCSNCGYLHEGLGAPEQCPACNRSFGYFELLCENW